MQIIIIGAGPIGLEMGLAARAEGHEVTVLEASEVGHHVGLWGHVTLFTPWSMNTTARGRAVIGDPSLEHSDQFPTGQEFRDRYLAPLADSLGVRQGHRVVSISRPWKRKGDEIGRQTRTESPFRLLVDTPDGEAEFTAQVVIDCSGVFGDPAPLGSGGSPVPGERDNPLVSYGPVPVDRFAGKRVLVVGDGASGTTVVMGLMALAPQPTVHWITPDEAVPSFVSPPDDPLPQRTELVRAAQAAATNPKVSHHARAGISRLHGGQVTLDDGSEFEVDGIIGCTGFRPDHSISRELQVHLCWASEGTMKLAGALLAAKGDGPADCLAGGAEGAELLKSPEPQFFVLGNKSYGRRSDFLLGVGHRQIDEVLGLLR